jgi:spore photoproduct lyase
MIKVQETKTLITKDNNNSANCIAPNLIYGCFGGCVDTYCYMSRYNGTRVFVNTNVDDIFNSVVKWEESFTKVPDQQDPVYTMVDIACNTDLVLMQKHMPEQLIDYFSNFNKFPRVRVSLMPQKYSNILEPKMQDIKSRIHDINRLKLLGWEVHINYSPLIFYPGWQDEYEKLFRMVSKIAGENKCEVIALTNHANQMNKASDKAKDLMKRSYEVKNKSGIMRYPIEHKTRLIQEFKDIYSKYFNLDTIRYIF